MRRQIKGYILLITLILPAVILVSCEDVITVNLKNVTPRIVIEGSVSNLSDSVIILLHKTTDYYKPTDITPVNDAQVILTDSTGISHQLLKVADGIYASDNFPGRPGDIFDLQVTEGATVYSGSSKMPFLVSIDTIVIDKNPDRPDEDRINILIKDPEGIENFYMVDIFKNDSLLNTGNHFILFHDKYFDGKYTYLPVSGRRLGLTEFKAGDRVTVRLKNIEKTIYDYFDILSSITEDMQLSVSSPSNPPNKLSNGALGYFAAWSVSVKTVIKF
jgi:hypothetical protein